MHNNRLRSICKEIPSEYFFRSKSTSKSWFRSILKVYFRSSLHARELITRAIWTGAASGVQL